MSTITKKRPSDVGTDKAPPMVHIVKFPNVKVAICGAPLLGIPAPDSAPLDCIVCAQLAGWDA